MRALTIVGLAFFVGLAACKGGDAGAGAEGGAAPATGGGGAKTTSLTQAQLDEAYKLADPDKIDKSVTAVTGKLGAPQKTEGDSSIWYGVGKDGKSCYQLKISKTKGIDSGTTDKANCGMK